MEEDSIITQYYETRQKRLALDRESSALENKEEVLKMKIIRDFDSLPTPPGLSVTLTHDEVPFVNDWPTFQAWVKENDAFDCIEKRVSKAATMARIEGHDCPMGVEVLKKPKLTVEPEKKS